MKRMSKLLLAALAFSAVSAQATTLTFDGVGYVVPFTSYTEGGYTLTLVIPNPTGYAQHIGDAGVGNTFNWHDEGDNGIGAYVVLTKDGGGLFNLSSLDYVNQGSAYGGGGTLVVASGATSYSLSASGATALSFNGVSSVTFSSANYSYNQIDNLNVTAAVPEPETYAMLAGGLALLGAVARRRAKRA